MVLVDPDRAEQASLRPCVESLSGGLAHDLPQQDADPVVVVEAGAGIRPDGLRDDVVDPPVARLEDHRGVRRVLVGLAGDRPVDPAAHGEEILQRGRGAARVREVDAVRLEERPRLGLHVRDVPLVHRDAERDRGHALGHGLERVQVGVPVIRVPRRVIVVVLMVGRVLLRGQEFGVRLGVVPVPVRNHSAVADEEEVVDEAVPTRVDIGDERVDRGRVDAFGRRGGNGPRLSRPGGAIGFDVRGAAREGEPPHEQEGLEDRPPHRRAAATLPPSTVRIAPVVARANARETNACATSPARTSRPRRLPRM